jgi:hypothetical protein
LADDAGALLVRSGLVSSTALDEARARTADLGGTLGEQLVATGAVADDRLTEFYRQRLLVPQVNPNTLARLPAKVVAVIPSEMAVELRAIPVSLDGDNNLTVAMSDPSDRHAVDEIAFFTGAYVVRAVATQMQIAWCLAHYYGHVTPLGQRLLRDDPSPAQPPAARPKSITEQVKASRHRRVERGELLVERKAREEQEAREAEHRPTLQQATVSDDSPTPVDTPNPKQRARTASGEIRTPPQRAPSVRPPLPDDSGQIEMIVGEPSGPVITMEVDESLDSGPVITIEAPPPGREDITARTKPAPRPVPKRRRPAKTDPPELAARAGEVQLASGESIKKIDFEEPSIMISDELERAFESAVSGEVAGREAKEPPPADDLDVNSTVVIRDQIFNETSEPVLLVEVRPSEPIPAPVAAAPTEEIVDDPSDVVVLETKKAPSPPKRVSAHTQVGIGVVSAITRPRGKRDSRDDLDHQSTDLRARRDADRTHVEVHAVAPDEDYTSTSDEMLAAPPSPYMQRDSAPVSIVQPKPQLDPPGPSGQVRFDKVKPRAPSRVGDEDYEDDDDMGGRSKPTLVMSAVELDEMVPGRSSEIMPAHLGGAADDGDEDWGPPGSTIPPPLLGSIPGALDEQSGVIPIPDVDTAPLIMAPPSAPEAGSRKPTTSDAGLARALQDATNRVFDLIRTLDHTTNRDQVIAVMIAHLAESHQRAGFFVTRAGELALFAIMPRVPTMPIATLRLDRPSTLADVVGTRLPYRGPMHDEASRTFVASVLGVCPPELLLVPISVRERVVGVLFGDQRLLHTFDDQLALAARGAGMALERILKAKRSES